MEKKFTIVLPLYKGERYVKKCVESILAQSIGDFDLVVLDNNCGPVIREWFSSLKDSRILVFPSDIELSIEDNWKRILKIPKYEFMTIIGHDDLLDSNFLEVINNLIKKYPDASLYHAHFRIIDEDGKFVRHCFPVPERETTSEFLAARLIKLRDSFGTGYVMRSRHYEKIGGIPSYRNLLYADDALFLLLMENSWKATSPEECFSYRLHRDSMSGMLDIESQLGALEEYIQFLDKLRMREESVNEIIRKYGPSFFLNECGHFYFTLLVKSCRAGNYVEKSLYERIRNLLDWVSPEMFSNLRKLPNIKRWERYNKTIFRKEVYYLFEIYKWLQIKFKVTNG